MHIKEDITLYLKRTVLHFKSIGILFYIPLLIVNVLIPVIAYLRYQKSGISELLYTDILQYTQWLVPFFSIWWILFVLREYIEADGNELLYVHSDRCKLKDILYIFVIYILDVGLTFTIYTLLFTSMKYEYLKIITVCIFYLGATYFFTYLTNSITITLLISLFYTLVNLVFGTIGNTCFPMYLSLKKISLERFLSLYLPLAVSGVFLIFIGTLLNKKNLKFT